LDPPIEIRPKDQPVDDLMEEVQKCIEAGERVLVTTQLRELNPDVLFVALGAPKQEYWIADHIGQLGIPVGMGIGGSMDVLSGNVKRAPKWMQKLCLEWLYRLLIQPSRYKRMLALPKFMLAVKKQK
ncbi:MAG: WecB/TagA/CpsF family glycosyltransferase, partial [Peptococcaceae bacterium]|nr:WecB/TagA/CpsF family glycosyltransferase [Peptococcaceae bacterium]